PRPRPQAPDLRAARPDPGELHRLPQPGRPGPARGRDDARGVPGPARRDPRLDRRPHHGPTRPTLPRFGRRLRNGRLEATAGGRFALASRTISNPREETPS